MANYASQKRIAPSWNASITLHRATGAYIQLSCGIYVIRATRQKTKWRMVEGGARGVLLFINNQLNSIPACNRGHNTNDSKDLNDCIDTEKGNATS